MVDMVVHRHDLPSTIARLCRFFTNTDTPEPKEAAVPMVDLVDEEPVAAVEDAPATAEAADPAEAVATADEPKATNEAAQDTSNK